MKRYLLVFAAVLCALCSCTKTATDIILDSNRLPLVVGESTTLHATVLPSDASNQLVYWSTSDSGVATVSNGVVKAVSEGEATITVRTDDGGVSASCQVIVSLERIQVEGIKLDKNSIELYEDECDTLNVTFFPDNATDKGILWTSSNEDIAKVIDGVVVAVKADTSAVTITAASVDGAKKAECEVKVSCKVAGVILDDVNVAINEGETYTLKAIVYPQRATNKELTWTSSDASVATVENGLISAVKAGSAIITVETADGGMKYECKVIVRSPVSGLSIDKTELLMFEGEKESLTATIFPANASNQKINWKSDNVAVVSINENGNKCEITAVSAGTACVHAVTAEGGCLETCTITVVKHVSAVSINVKNKEMFEGDSYTLTAVVTPSDAYDKTVEWSSSNEQVASVANGVVKANSKGEADITVKTKDGELTAVCHIVVKCIVEKATVQASAILYRDETLDLSKTLKIEPANADYTEVTWISDRPDAVKVDANGIVMAIATMKDGNTAKVYAKIVSDGKDIFSSPCLVEVRAHVEGVKFEKTSFSIEEHDAAVLKYSILPENAYDKAVKWSTSNSTVVAVDPETGEIFARSIGEADITVETKDGGKTDVCHVTVLRFVNKIELDKNALTLEVSKSATLTATVSPADAANKILKWSSSDESVATVSPTGLVTAKGQGTATITVATTDGKNTTETCTVTVVKMVSGVSLDQTSLTLNPGETADLTATVTPSDATNPALEWTTSDAKVVVVNDGKLTAVGSGTATVTAASTDGTGIKASCQINVCRFVDKVSIDETVTLYKGETHKLTIAIDPADAVHSGITWVSSDAVSVTADGVVTGLKGGFATVFADVVSGGKTVRSNPCSIEVLSQVESLSLNKTSISKDKGMSDKLYCTVYPSDANNQDVVWSSSNPSVASVDNDGVVTLKEVGSAIITVTSVDGGKTATCNVTVTDPVVYVKAIILNAANIPLTVGATKQLEATINPSNATNKTLAWTSDNPSVAFVDENGLITGVTAGTAVITAASTDGSNIKQTCIVQVTIIPVSVVSITPKTLKLNEKETSQLTVTITPSNAGDKTVKWNSSNPAVATVDANGKITAVAPGTTSISATSNQNQAASDYCVVEVIDNSVKVTSVTLNETHKLLEIGHALKLLAVIAPDNATNKTLTWSSSNDTVATVDKNGNVMAVSKGDAIITATSNNGITASCSIEVVDQIIPVSGVTISQQTLELYIGEKYQLQAFVSPYNATYTGITWDTSVGSSIICVKGLVTALKEGSANVFAISEGTDSDGDHRNATCLVTVKKHNVDTIVFSDNSRKLKVGDKITMKATAYCNDNGSLIDPSVPGVTWSSSNSSVATIDRNTGELVAKSKGTVTITATSVDYISTIVGFRFTTNTCVIEVVDGTVGKGGTEDLEFKKLF